MQKEDELKDNFDNAGEYRGTMKKLLNLLPISKTNPVNDFYVVLEGA